MSPGRTSGVGKAPAPATSNPAATATAEAIFHRVMSISLVSWMPSEATAAGIDPAGPRHREPAFLGPVPDGRIAVGLPAGLVSPTD